MSDLPHWKRDAPENEEQRAAFLRALALAEEFSAAAWALAKPAPPPAPVDEFRARLQRKVVIVRMGRPNASEEEIERELRADPLTSPDALKLALRRLEMAREAVASVPSPTAKEREEAREAGIVGLYPPTEEERAEARDLAYKAVNAAWVSANRLREGRNHRQDMDIVEMVERCATETEPAAGPLAVEGGLAYLSGLYPDRKLDPGLFAQAVENWKGSGAWVLEEPLQKLKGHDALGKWGSPLRRLLGLPAGKSPGDLRKAYNRHRKARAWQRRLDLVE